MASRYVERLLDRFYGEHINGTAEFRTLIEEHLKPGHYLLDLGCGKGRAELDFTAKCGFVAGCDQATSVTDNKFVSSRIRGDAYQLPFGGSVFDVVISDFVLEHLEFPSKVFREIARVLRPGGIFLFRTPNFYHYVALTAYLTPHSFHRFLVRNLAHDEEADAFETFYRANTRADLEGALADAGFQIKAVHMVEKEPYYLTFAAPAFLMGCLYERLVNRFDYLARFRSNIFGCFAKLHNDETWSGKSI